MAFIKTTMKSKTIPRPKASCNSPFDVSSAIAVVMVRVKPSNPTVLFLEEPTANLDPAATKAIEHIVQEVSTSGVKIVMATQDLGEARRLAGDIIFLHRGGVIESGPADAFFAAPATDDARRFLAGDLLI